MHTWIMIIVMATQSGWGKPASVTTSWIPGYSNAEICHKQAMAFKDYMALSNKYLYVEAYCSEIK